MRITTSTTYTQEMERVAASCGYATFYHSRAWAESLAATFSHMTFGGLVARDGETVCGFFPYFTIRRGPLRTVWSMPFGTYGGPVGTDDGCIAPLRRAYARLPSAAGVVNAGWIDFNHRGSFAGWHRTPASTHLIDLTGGFDRLWAETITAQRKKRTRRAERLGVRVRRMESDRDLERYYSIYLAKLREWGEKAVYPLRLFEELLGRGGDSVRLYVAEHDGRVVGGHFNFYWKRTVTAWNGVTTPESNSLQPGTLLYIECLRGACREGFEVYNLGGSLGKKSLIEFKESLGGDRREYCQYRRRSFLGKVAGAVRKVGGRRRGR